MATLITATCKYGPGKVLDTVKGPKINAVVTLPDGEEHKIWTKPNDRRLQGIKKGDKVKLLKDGNTYKLIQDDEEEPHPDPVVPTPAPPPPVITDKWSDGHRAEVYNELRRRAGVLAACHAHIREQFTNTTTGECAVSEATIQQYAALLYADLKELW